MPTAVKKLLPPAVEIHLPRPASYWSCLSVPPRTAVTFACVGDTLPKSTWAETPTEHETSSALKYGSGHVPLKSVTLRAIGGFGGAPEPPVGHPRTNMSPFEDPMS